MKSETTLFKWSIWVFALFAVSIINGFAQAESNKPAPVLEKPKIEVPPKNEDQEEILKETTKKGHKRPVEGAYHRSTGKRTKPVIKSGSQLDNGSDSSQGPSDTPTMGGSAGSH